MNPPPPPPRTTNRPAWAWISVAALQVLQALSLLPWLPMALMSFMAFDAPDATQHWEPWAFVIGFWSYPVWLLAAGVAAWVLFAFGKPILAVLTAVIFTLPAVLVAAALFLGNA